MLETAVGEDIGEYFERDTALLEVKAWNKFISNRQGCGDFLELSFSHLARDLIKRYKVHGVPVKSHMRPWTKGMLDWAIKWGAHKSC